MELATPTTAGELAARTGARLLGDAACVVTGLNEIHHVRPGDLCFVDHPRYYERTLASPASVVLIDREFACPPGKALLVTEDPFAAYNALVEEARPREQSLDWGGAAARPTIGSGTVLAPTAVLGRGVTVGRDCTVGPGVVIGDGCTLGDRVVVGANSVIGGEAFYYKKTAEGYLPWRSAGSVLLEDDVELGPGCTIARGVSAVTTIGRGSKLDAQVQIGHDCRLGPHCLLASQVGVAGNTVIGEWSVLLGQVGVAQNLTLGPRTFVAAKSGVSKNLEGDNQYFGYPAQRMRDQLREWAILRRLRREG